LSILGSLKRELGSLEKVAAWLQVRVMINTAEGFTKTANVADGFSVANWESVVQKTVRSSEGNLIGSVDAVDENSILVSSEGGRTRYKIPKHIVQGFDGHQVSLNVQKAELERFKGAEAEGFGEVK
jgi:hypothetical protein